MNQEQMRREYADTVEYYVWLLHLVTTEARTEQLTPKQIDKKPARLRGKLEPDQIAEAERVVKLVHSGAKKVLANR